MAKRIAAVISLLMALVLGGVVASPAHAGPPVEGCVGSEQEFCLHDTATSDAFMKWVPEDAPRNVCLSGVTPITSYIRNYSPFRWWVYTGVGCTGTRGNIYPNSEGGMNATFNNKIRAVARTSSLTFTFEGPNAILVK